MVIKKASVCRGEVTTDLRLRLRNSKLRPPKAEKTPKAKSRLRLRKAKPHLPTPEAKFRHRNMKFTKMCLFNSVPADEMKALRICWATKPVSRLPITSIV